MNAPRVYTPRMRLAKQRQLVGTTLHPVHWDNTPNYPRDCSPRFYVRGYEDKTITLFQHLFTAKELQILDFKSDLFTIEETLLQIKDLFKSPTVCKDDRYIHYLDHWLMCDSDESLVLLKRLFNFFQVSPSKLTELNVNKPGFELALETKSLRRELLHEGTLDNAIAKAIGACTNNSSLRYFFINCTETSATLLGVNGDAKLEALGSSIIFIPAITTAPEDAKVDLQRRQNLHRRAQQELIKRGYILARTSAEILVPSLTNCLVNDDSRPAQKASNIEMDFFIKLECTT